MVTHTGGLSGVLTQVTMIPDLKLGIIVFTNQQSSEAFSSITNTILDSYLGIEGRDRVSENFERFQTAANEARKIVNEVEKVVESAKGGLDIEELKKYCGTFKDSWLGEVKIDLSGERLRFTSARSPKLSGEMFFYKGNTFIVKWDDRSFDADAFAVYTLDREGVADSFTMMAVSPLTDFSYDFHDLLFKRQ